MFIGPDWRAGNQILVQLLQDGWLAVRPISVFYGSLCRFHRLQMETLDACCLFSMLCADDPPAHQLLSPDM